MNPMTSLTAMVLTQACPDGLSPTVRTRLQHLFRHSLRAGRIHPLYQPILSYRLTHANRGQR